MDHVAVAQLMRGLDWLESHFLQQSINIDRDGGKGYPDKVQRHPAITTPRTSRHPCW